MKLIKLFKRKNYKKKFYYAEYEIDGKIKRISLKASIKEEAIKNWNMFLENFKKNEEEKFTYKEKITSITIEEGFNEYVIYKKKKSENSTFRHEVYMIERFKNFLIENNTKTIQEISISIFEKYIKNLIKNELSPKTINNYICTTNCIIKHFHKNKYIPQNIIIDIPAIWQERKKQKIVIITRQEAKIVIDYFREIPDPEMKVCMLFPIFTGLRFSEVKGLNRKNVDIEEGKINVCEKQTEGMLKPTTTLKTRSAYRTLNISPDFLPILSEYLEIEKREYPFSGLTYNRMKKYFKHLIKEKHIDYYFHMGRHYFASVLIHSKLFSILEITQMLGHKDTQTTLDIYSHLIEDIDQVAFGKVIFS
jgi:integrase